MSIKTSVGTSTANSYIGVSDANTYFNSVHDADSWVNINTTNYSSTTAVREKKENLLIQATRELDDNLKFNGGKYNTGIYGDVTYYQALEFPRSSNVNNSGDIYIVDEVKDATCEQAIWILERGGKRVTEDGAVIQLQKVGDVPRHLLRYWINRQIQPCGRYKWQGSDA